MANRAKAEAFIIRYIKRLSPNSQNAALYQNFFKSMTDAAFDEFMLKLNEGKIYLSLIEPNNSQSGLSVENNLKIAEELGHNFFERLWIDGKNGEPAYLTPIPYLVVDLPVRRASQLLTKKIKVPEHNKTVDILTGQPTGDSKGAKISYPELQVCAAMGLEESMVELMKYRGGDVRGNKAYNAMLSKTGKANLTTLSNYASGVESVKTLRTFMNAMHLKVLL